MQCLIRRVYSTIVMSLACPYTHHAVAASLNKVAVSNAHALNNRRAISLLCGVNSSTAVPLPALQLVVDLDNVFARRTDNSSRIEHHAGYGVVVCIRVVDGTGS